MVLNLRMLTLNLTLCKIKSCSIWFELFNNNTNSIGLLDLYGSPCTCTYLKHVQGHVHVWVCGSAFLYILHIETICGI